MKGRALVVAIQVALPTLALATESLIVPTDRVTHYRVCENLSVQCVRAITFPEGTQSYYFRWKQCVRAQEDCLKKPVPQSALDALAAEEAKRAAEAALKKAEKAAAAAAERAAREELRRDRLKTPSGVPGT